MVKTFTSEWISRHSAQRTYQVVVRIVFVVKGDVSFARRFPTENDLRQCDQATGELVPCDCFRETGAGPMPRTSAFSPRVWTNEIPRKSFAVCKICQRHIVMHIPQTSLLMSQREGTFLLSPISPMYGPTFVQKVTSPSKLKKSPPWCRRFKHTAEQILILWLDFWTIAVSTHIFLHFAKESRLCTVVSTIDTYMYTCYVAKFMRKYFTCKARCQNSIHFVSDS